jgi:isoleucyl-tRNA synthetase
VIKDRLYTDAPDSPRRRSTQTALYRLVTGLCKMLAPLLAFTADEAWEFIPGTKESDSVHATLWTPTRFERPVQERSQWKELLGWREAALPALESARRDKLIGKALEAKLRLTVPSGAASLSEAQVDDLRELLNVSQLEVSAAPSEAGTSVAVACEVVRADGQKCERCWHWDVSVGTRAEHPTICGRCLGAISHG